ncbi:hypothetical protein IMSAG192_01221 [Muribaculaceae bacterium]|nr:hypothetical protein IMSAG192_01221 [Muribaculaceae bacterium]
MKNTGFNNRRMTVIGWKFVTLQYGNYIEYRHIYKRMFCCADYGWQCD